VTTEIESRCILTKYGVQSPPPCPVDTCGTSKNSLLAVIDGLDCFCSLGKIDFSCLFRQSLPYRRFVRTFYVYYRQLRIRGRFEKRAFVVDIFCCYGVEKIQVWKSKKQNKRRARRGISIPIAVVAHGNPAEPL